MKSNSPVIPYHVSLTPQADPPNADPIYAAIGRVIVSWGLFENQLDFGLMSILRMPDAEPIRPRLNSGEPIPASFKQKVKLWRKAFQRMTILSDYRAPALTIIDHAKKLATRRDSIVHGNWNNFRPGDPMKIVGVHFRLKGSTVKMTEHVATEDGFNQIADATRRLSSEMGSFLGAVYRVLSPGDADKSPQ